MHKTFNLVKAGQYRHGVVFFEILDGRVVQRLGRDSYKVAMGVRFPPRLVQLVNC